MLKVKRLLLDILKPHHPNVLEFAQSLAQHGDDYRVSLTVVEMDDKTESVEVIIEGEDIQFEGLRAAIEALGASLHSIDNVEVVNSPDTGV